jgi:hypothetical protein
MDLGFRTYVGILHRWTPDASLRFIWALELYTLHHRLLPPILHFDPDLDIGLSSYHYYMTVH